MRVPIPVLALAAALVLAGCGDDEPEQAEIPRPAPTQRPVRPDTTLGDTAGGAVGQAGGAARPGQPGEAGGQPSGQSGGQPGPQAGQSAPGQPGAGQGAGAGGETAGGRRLYTVQVAAFTSPDSAQKWTGRLASLNLPAWMSMAELGGTTYYRVRVGAVPTFTEARRLGALMSERLEWPVWVAPVTAADRMPADAVAATRRVLGGD